MFEASFKSILSGVLEQTILFHSQLSDAEVKLNQNPVLSCHPYQAASSPFYLKTEGEDLSLMSEVSPKGKYRKTEQFLVPPTFMHVKLDQNCNFVSNVSMRWWR